MRGFGICVCARVFVCVSGGEPSQRRRSAAVLIYIYLTNKHG